MKIREIIDALEKFAPLPLQEEYDNSGLQVGLTETEVSGALLCIDVTEAAVREAVVSGCNLIVSHHPLLFKPLKSLTDRTETERCVMEAVRNGITIYSAHTNLDNAAGGVNFEIASRLKLQNTGWLLQTGPDSGSGIIGYLPDEICEREFIDTIKSVFAVNQLRCNEHYDNPIRKVAVCGGSGAFLIPEAMAAGADAFITGEIGYHRFYGYGGRMLLIETGHFESEQYTTDLFCSFLTESFPQLKIRKLGRESNLIRYC